MKIVHLTAGAAGMYCGSCMHDNTLAAAIQRRGVDIALIPLYTPTRTDESNVSAEEIFFGGVNIYLQMKSGLFRHLPGFAERFLNSRAVLSLASRFSSSTDAKQLGELTLAMLQGEKGVLADELERLTAWLTSHYQADVVVLSNSLFAGLAGELKRRTKARVVCQVQGEDIFLDDLVEPHRTQVLAAMRDKARDVDLFVASSRYYAEYMGSFLRLPSDRFRIVPLGIRLEGHGTLAKPAPHPERPFTIGYMARICPEKGLHLLVEALRVLDAKHGRGSVKLVAAGWLGGRDRRYFEEIVRKVSKSELEPVFEYRGEVDREAKLSLLNEVDVLSVPTTYREPKGIFVLEALANRTPVVVPRHGAFPEWIQATGGGVLFEPGSVESLVEALESLMHDFEKRRQMGQRGRDSVERSFSDDAMAHATLEVYADLLKPRPQE